MKFIVASAIAIMAAACGQEAQREGPASLGDQCEREGEPCIRYGYGDARDGTCRSYQDAPGTFACCAGCWDPARDFCHSGGGAPSCGTLGEDCAAEKCR